MFLKIFRWFFPEPKTMIECAVDKILDQDFVHNHGLKPVDPVNGSYFAVGKVKLKDCVLSKDYMIVNFGKNDETVVIKYMGEIMFFFNNPEEVKMIRKAIKVCHRESDIEYKNRVTREFHRL